MVRALADRLLLVCVACILTFAALARLDEPPQRLPLIHADYQRCVMIHPGPLYRPRGRLDTRRNSNTPEIV